MAARYGSPGAELLGYTRRRWDTLNCVPLPGQHYGCCLSSAEKDWGPYSENRLRLPSNGGLSAPLIYGSIFLLYFRRNRGANLGNGHREVVLADFSPVYKRIARGFIY